MRKQFFCSLFCSLLRGMIFAYTWCIARENLMVDNDSNHEKDDGRVCCSYQQEFFQSWVRFSFFMEFFLLVWNDLMIQHVVLSPLECSPAAMPWLGEQVSDIFRLKKMHHWRWANMPWSFTLTGEAVVLSIVNGKLPILLRYLFLVLDMLISGRLGSLSLARLIMAYPDAERCVCLMIYSVLEQD